MQSFISEKQQRFEILHKYNFIKPALMKIVQRFKFPKPRIRKMVPNLISLTCGKPYITAMFPVYRTFPRLIFAKSRKARNDGN
jgi:hypothetical protein